MKKILFVVAAVASMVFTACNKEEFSVIENAAVGTIEFTASFDAETKTTLNSGKTEWIKGDEISINGVKFTANASGASVKFTNAETPQDEFKAPFTAVYPYSKTLPSEQTVSDGTFADESVVSVAYIDEKGNSNLTFKHVSSVIKFQVTNNVASAIVFESSKPLAGKLTVTASADALTYGVSGDASTKITVKSSTGTFKAGETYYVSVLPSDGEKVNFSAKVEDVIVKSGTVELKRNTIMDARSIEVKYVYLKPSLVWNLSSPRYAAYFFEGGANAWVNLTDSDSDGVYSAIVPAGYTNLIFCRMNPNNKENRWNKEGESNAPVWNQSADLKVPTDANVAYVGGIMKWDASSGNWKTLADAKNYRENAVYLKPNSNWKQSNAWFAAYLCNGSKGAKWLKMESVDGTFYGVELPSDFNATNYKNIIFVRMDSGKNALDWGSKWNQSGDLACTMMTNSPYNRCCAINNGQWDCGSSVTWTTVLK